MGAKGRGTGEKAPAGGKRKDAAGCRKMLREKLVEEYPEILGAFVTAAKKGSAAHMKLATELLEEKSEVAKRGGGSVAKLLRELDEEQGEGWLSG